MFSYEGSVTIIRKYRGRVLGRTTFHNSGTQALFRELCNRLVKGSTTRQLYPYYLDLARKGSQESLLRAFRPPVSDKVETVTTDSSSTYRAVKTFYLSYYDLDMSKGNNGESLVFRLMSDYDSEHESEKLAEVTLKSGESELTEYTIGEGETHEIIWEMSFNNIDSGSLDAGRVASQSLEESSMPVVQSLEQEVNE